MRCSAGLSPYNPRTNEDNKKIIVGRAAFSLHWLRRLLHWARRLLRRCVARRARAYPAVPQDFAPLVSCALHRALRRWDRRAALGARALRVSRWRAALSHLRRSADAMPHVSVLAGSDCIVRKLAARSEILRRHRPRRGYSARRR